MTVQELMDALEDFDRTDVVQINSDYQGESIEAESVQTVAPQILSDMSSYNRVVIFGVGSRAFDGPGAG